MDFIERWFGISPDGGSGSLEMTFFAVPLIILAVLLLYRRTNLFRRHSR
ncbi:MAG TPA: hypothetical protein VE422_26555 [Terriglobia bacterium]|nr:hypothetical protein [Terriglobia bacterium]